MHIKQNHTKKGSDGMVYWEPKKGKKLNMALQASDSDNSILQSSAQELTDTHKNTHTEVNNHCPNHKVWVNT